jgi:hypothetical protein
VDDKLFSLQLNFRLAIRGDPNLVISLARDRIAWICGPPCRPHMGDMGYSRVSRHYQFVLWMHQTKLGMYLFFRGSSWCILAGATYANSRGMHEGDTGKSRSAMASESIFCARNSTRNQKNININTNRSHSGEYKSVAWAEGVRHPHHRSQAKLVVIQLVVDKLEIVHAKVSKKQRTRTPNIAKDEISR